MGLNAELKLRGNDFSNAATAFFIAYLVAEVPNGRVVGLLLRDRCKLIGNSLSHHLAKGSSGKVARCKCNPMGYRNSLHSGSKELPIPPRSAHFPWNLRSGHRAVVDADQ